MMKRKIKDVVARIVYGWYAVFGGKNRIRVHSVDETIDELLHTEKSLVRFGDGEIVITEGKDLQLQTADKEIERRLSAILGYRDENLMVCLPDIFYTLKPYTDSTGQFWRDHLLFFRKTYKKYCDFDKVYYNSFISRCYNPYQDKRQCDKWFEKIRHIWDNKRIVVVEGTRSHDGVGNDLLDLADGIERIICPAQNAFERYEEIYAACRTFPKDRLFLLSLGVPAKLLAEDLFRDGYRVLDIGNLDMEYEWYLHRTGGKAKLEKHEVIGEEANRKAGYTEYLNQVHTWIV